MWTFIPLKDFVQAKQRLSGVLSASERRCLFQAMVEDVLDVLTRLEALDRIVLLSDDPAAGLLAEHYHIDCWSEKALGAGGLNSVVNAAVKLVGPEVSSIMIAHGDLPLATLDEWQYVLDTHSRAGERKVTIVTDRQCDGSNVILCSPPGALTYNYGPESCHRHRAQAQLNNLEVEIVELQGLSRDMDDREDLVDLLGREWGRRAPKTLKYLRDNGLKQRIKALAAGEANSAFIRMGAIEN